MAYIVRADIEDVFGVDNVKTWADLDNSGNLTDIAARITVAITKADALIDDMLRGGMYTIPFTGTIPETIKDISAKLAGVWLYEARGTSDVSESSGEPVHRLTWARDSAMSNVRKILAGVIRLDLTTRITYPQIVEDAD